MFKCTIHWKCKLKLQWNANSHPTGWQNVEVWQCRVIARIWRNENLLSLLEGMWIPTVLGSLVLSGKGVAMFVCTAPCLDSFIPSFCETWHLTSFSALSSMNAFNGSPLPMKKASNSNDILALCGVTPTNFLVYIPLCSVFLMLL